jgi:hypothetical protein
MGWLLSHASLAVSGEYARIRNSCIPEYEDCLKGLHAAFDELQSSNRDVRNRLDDALFHLEDCFMRWSRVLTKPTGTGLTRTEV